MRNIILLVILYMGLILSPGLIFAGGSKDKDRCDLTIENNTGEQITQIVIGESESGGTPQIHNRNLPNNTSTVIQIKKNVLYDIVLVATNERQFAKRRQTWNDATANILFAFRDFQDQNVWDKIKRVILWPRYR